MKVKFNVSKLGSGKKRNEDVIGCNNGYAWVIDGATPLFPEKIAVYDYVKALSKELNIITQYPCLMNLEEIVTKAVNNVHCLKPLHCEEFESPHFAIAFVKVSGQTAEYYMLGDCKIATYTDTMSLYEDTRIKPFAEVNRKVNTTEQRQKTRKLANTAEGYPIGSYSGVGLSKGKTGTIPLSKGEKIMLYSDGFDGFEDKAALFNKEDARDTVCLFKTTDDCSVVLLET